MIRSALIALGLSASGLGAGAAGAQGMVATAPILDVCGGTRLVLQAEDDVDTDELDAARDVVNRRVGGAFSQVFDVTSLHDNQIIVAIPTGMDVPDDAIEPLLQRIDLGFYEVDRAVSTDVVIDLGATQIALPDAEFIERNYVLNTPPILDGTMVASATATFDYNNRPAIAFRFDAQGAAIFAQYTADNIGHPFAIVVADKVMSAPTIQSSITGGSGIITGNFTSDETVHLAAVLQGGVLPFDLNIVAQDIMDGSDPSSDFCP